jgi:hypothetical protein
MQYGGLRVKASRKAVCYRFLVQSRSQGIQFLHNVGNAFNMIRSCKERVCDCTSTCAAAARSSRLCLNCSMTHFRVNISRSFSSCLRSKYNADGSCNVALALITSSVAHLSLNEATCASRPPTCACSAAGRVNVAELTLQS